jgi:hypothetical protein
VKLGFGAKVGNKGCGAQVVWLTSFWAFFSASILSRFFSFQGSNWLCGLSLFYGSDRRTCWVCWGCCSLCAEVLGLGPGLNLFLWLYWIALLDVRVDRRLCFVGLVVG